MIADIPGLIEGAHEGAGIGDRFLGHVERCAALLHLVDITQEDVCNAYDIVRTEVEAYDDGLRDRAEIIALTKIDATSEDEITQKHQALADHTGKEVHIISSAAHINTKPLLSTLAKLANAQRQQDKTSNDEDTSWSPAKF